LEIWQAIVRDYPEMAKMLFISDEKHMQSTLKGGVQVCTQEYLSLIRSAGFDVSVHPIAHTKKLFNRIKIKLSIDTYQRYDFNDLVGAIEEKIIQEKIQFVALNQVGLAPFARRIKQKFGQKVTVLVLSHGNESGDFLHEILRDEHKNVILKIRDIFKLGLLVFKESMLFSKYIDLVVSMSETEIQINNWLGAKNGLFVPRTFSPSFLTLQPQKDRVGFIGTLDHLPNALGLEQFLKEFEKINSNKVQLRLIGGPESVGQAMERKFKCVSYLGRLSEDALKAEVASWACSVNPIFWYSRGASTKLAQIINWGLPVVTTTPGNRGYVWQEGGLLTAANAHEMAKMVFDLTASDEMIAHQAEQSRKVANNGPRIEKLACKLNEILGRI